MTVSYAGVIPQTNCIVTSHMHSLKFAPFAILCETNVWNRFPQRTIETMRMQETVHFLSGINPGVCCSCTFYPCGMYLFRKATERIRIEQGYFTAFWLNSSYKLLLDLCSCASRNGLSSRTHGGGTFLKIHIAQ